MKKILSIILVGSIAGAIDLIPLIMVNAPLMNMFSIICFWIVATLFISTTKLLKNHALNGLLIAVLIMLPVVLTVYTINPKDFIPMLSMAVILGPLVGFSLLKFQK